MKFSYDEGIQNKVVELAKEKLEWLKTFKQNNGGIHIDLDEEIEFQMEEMQDFVSEYSRRKINKECCERAVKELSQDLHYEMICHIMGDMFRTALGNKVNKHEYDKRGYDAKASVPYFTSDGHANVFEYSFSTKYIYGIAEYVQDNEVKQCHVDLSINDLKDFNGKLWRVPRLNIEDSRICLLMYEKSEGKNWDRIGDMIWDMNEDTTIEKSASFLKSLNDNRYKIYVSYKGQYIMYISFNVKEGKLGFFKLDSLESCREIGNRLINKIKESVK